MLELPTLLFRLILAAILSGLFGYEREKRHKKAGFRTNMLVGLGSSLIMILSMTFGNDPARIAAGVVTGIGFLGAGLIIQGQKEVYGITTAATIWIVAAVGMATGAGYYSAAIATTIVALIVLYVFGNDKVREIANLND